MRYFQFSNGSSTKCDFVKLPELTLQELNALPAPTLQNVLVVCTAIGIMTWNGLCWEVIDALKENLVGSVGGSVVPLNVTSNTAGGTLSTEIPENQSYWNNTTNYARLGQSSLGISTAETARQALATNANFRLYSSSKLYFGAVLAFVGGQVDFATDSVLQCWGYLDNFATATPTNGFYFRPPRVGETSFLKCVVLVAGAESAFDTTISYDSTSRRYVKGDIIWDGVNLHFWATDTTNRSLNTIPNFLTTYPSLGTLNLGFGFLNARISSSSPIARSINVDIVSYKIF